MLDDYLQQLTEDDAQHHSSGAFTLDAASARQQMAAHRLDSLLEALLQIVAAASLAGATRLELSRTLHNQALDLRIRGWKLDGAQLPHLLSRMFNDDQPRALRELAAALNSLVPRHARGLELRADGFRVVYDGGEWNTLQRSDDREAFALLLLLPNSLRQRWGRALARWRKRDELTALAARTRWCDSPQVLTPDPKSLLPVRSEPWPLHVSAIALISFLSPTAPLRPFAPLIRQVWSWSRSTRALSSLRCGLSWQNPAESSLLIVHNGVSLARWSFAADYLHVSGVVNTDGVDLDLGRRGIVANARWTALKARLREWIGQGVAAWIESLETLDDEQRVRLQGWLERISNVRREQPVRLALERQPLVPLAGGGWISVEMLRPLVKRFDGLHTAAPRERADWLHDRPLVNSESPLVKTFAQLYGWRKVRSNNHLQDPPRFDESRFQDAAVTSIQIRRDHWNARVYVSPRASAQSVVQIWRHGKPFQSLRPRLFRDFPCCLDIWLDGDFDDNLAAAAARLLQELRQALLDQAEELLSKLWDGPATAESMYAALRLCAMSSLRQSRPLWSRLPSWVHQRPLALQSEEPPVTFDDILYPERSRAAFRGELLRLCQLLERH